jgi:hypothetical protein
MAAVCGRWVKYVFLLVLFIFAFVCLFTPSIAIYGFGTFFVMQSILSFFVFIDVTQDDEVAKKTLTVDVANGKSPVNIPAFKLPLSWILSSGALMEFVAGLFMIMSMSTVYKRFHALPMSSENQWRLDFVKYTFVIVTVLMFLLVMVYWNYDLVMKYDSMKTLVLAVVVGIVGVSIADVVYANYFLKLINLTTDG